MSVPSGVRRGALPARMRPARLGDQIAPTARMVCLVAVAVGGAAFLGALAAYKPIFAVGAVGAAGLAAVAVLDSRPILLALGLISFIVLPYRYFPGLDAYVQLQKGLLYLGGVVLLVRRGAEPWRLLPLVAYPIAAAMSALGGSPYPGISAGDTLNALLTLTCAWVVFAARWDAERDVDLLRVLAWLPVACLVIGALLEGAHLYTFFNNRTPPRLQGALIPAFLATTALVATAASVVLHRLELWRWAPYFVFVNAAVLVATLTRGAMIALVVLLIPTVVRLLVGLAKNRSAFDTARVGVALLALVAVVVVAAPSVAQRDDEKTYVAGKGLVDDGTSGRSAAWHAAYAEAEENLVFGRGVGAGPLVGEQTGHFLAQHNEYLRMLLETGFVGGVLLVTAMAGSLTWTIRRADPRVRRDLACLAVGMGLFSYTDNTLTSSQVATGVLVVIGLGAALGRSSSRARRGSPEGRRATSAAPQRRDDRLNARA